MDFLPVIQCKDLHAAIGEQYIGNGGNFNAGTEFFGLLLHLHHQFKAVDAFGKAGEIFHFTGLGKQTAGESACQQQRIQIGA